MHLAAVDLIPRQATGLVEACCPQPLVEADLSAALCWIRHGSAPGWLKREPDYTRGRARDRNRGKRGVTESEFSQLDPIRSVVSGSIAVHNSQPIWMPEYFDKDDATVQG